MIGYSWHMLYRQKKSIPAAKTDGSSPGRRGHKNKMPKMGRVVMLERGDFEKSSRKPSSIPQEKQMVKSNSRDHAGAPDEASVRRETKSMAVILDWIKLWLLR